MGYCLILAPSKFCIPTKSTQKIEYDHIMHLLHVLGIIIRNMKHGLRLSLLSFIVIYSTVPQQNLHIGLFQTSIIMYIVHRGNWKLTPTPCGYIVLLLYETQSFLTPPSGRRIFCLGDRIDLEAKFV
jgi:hypothetical protein